MGECLGVLKQWVGFMILVKHLHVLNKLAVGGAMGLYVVQEVRQSFKWDSLHVV